MSFSIRYLPSLILTPGLWTLFLGACAPPQLRLPMTPRNAPTISSSHSGQPTLPPQKDPKLTALNDTDPAPHANTLRIPTLTPNGNTPLDQPPLSALKADLAQYPRTLSPVTEGVATESSLEPMPRQMNSYVQTWIDYFVEKDHARFQRYLNQGNPYRPIVETLLREAQLPSELYYLALIESGYLTGAQSRAKAVGIWQFINTTGLRYGLHINAFTDERRDPIRSTKAAAKYLRDLYNVFGSWYLAIAAYNAGEYRVLGSVLRGKNRNFWALVQSRVLPEETAHYVPKFLAALAIGEHPEKFGFTLPSSQSYPELQAVDVPSPILLRDCAQALQLTPEELLQYNPNFLQALTPPDLHHYEVWVPTQRLGDPGDRKLRLAQLQVIHPLVPRGYNFKTPTLERAAPYHIVRKGETLRQIAARYHLSPQVLAQINRPFSSHLVVGTRLRLNYPQSISAPYQNAPFHLSSLPPGVPSDVATGRPAGRLLHAQKHPQAPRPLGPWVHYQVQPGDDLKHIARRFHSSVEQIKILNALKSSRVWEGQRLKLRAQTTR